MNLNLLQHVLLSKAQFQQRLVYFNPEKKKKHLVTIKKEREAHPSLVLRSMKGKIR